MYTAGVPKFEIGVCVGFWIVIWMWVLVVRKEPNDITIFGILMICFTIFIGIVPNLGFGVRNGNSSILNILTTFFDRIIVKLVFRVHNKHHLL